ncbi:septum site-determining protein MinC [Salinisphaera aquimarina]|uniref:Probable septum site-determining protein MinC n=1 Tax=Salinisphaera aquimarina TaxID=2094031 RepID=A0ABV7EM50_9GAMM
MAGTTTAAAAGVVFKGRMMTITVLEVRETDSDRIAKQIDDQLKRTPGFFSRMPVLLSLPDALPDLAALGNIVRDAGLMLVGVLDPNEQVAAAAADAGLSVIASPTRGSNGAERARKSAPEPKDSPPPARDNDAPESAKTPTRLVTRPVRSGQQIYARGGDLVIASSVSEGAEILADGHIHIYGALRGRALAGASGDTQARIFCRRFEPDLVAIAGCYKVADAIDEGVRSRAVQVSLEHDNLTIELQE